eukprot:COSAG02_NODE_11943_length_1637_cov_6.304319_2_plen_43_part_01
MLQSAESDTELKCGSWVAAGRIWTMSEWGVTRELNLRWYSEKV